MAMGTTDQPSLEAVHLIKRFGKFVAVDDVSFDVRPGEVFGLLGSNGAGKSTLIRLFCGLLLPTSGTARVLGVDTAKDPEAVRRRIGYMTQRFSLYDDLSVEQNLEFYGGIYGLRGRDKAERIAWAKEIGNLGGMEDKVVRSLPGGWKQRLALACSVLHRPRVLFLDEPTGGVDPLSRRRFWGLIDEMAAEGVTLIVTTHYLDEAERCDRIALLHAGRLVAFGTVGDLKEVFAGRAVLEVAAPRFLEANQRIEEQSWALETSLFGDRLHVVVADPEEGKRRILALLEEDGNTPASVERIVPSLEDVFIHSIESADSVSGGLGGAAGSRP